MRGRLHITSKSETRGGQKVYVITPDIIPPEHRDKLLIHVHGGCYVFSHGESGTTEAIMMAGLGHFKLFSVDSGMLPEDYFSAALTNGPNVYRKVLKTSATSNLAVFAT